MSAKDVLNELKWRNDMKIEDAVIFYVHRGAPNDEKCISGADILELGSSFFSTMDATVPYHRIFRIEYAGKILLDR